MQHINILLALLSKPFSLKSSHGYIRKTFLDEDNIQNSLEMAFCVYILDHEINKIRFWFLTVV